MATYTDAQNAVITAITDKADDVETTPEDISYLGTALKEIGVVTAVDDPTITSNYTIAANAVMLATKAKAEDLSITPEDLSYLGTALNEIGPKATIGEFRVMIEDAKITYTNYTVELTELRDGAIAHFDMIDSYAREWANSPEDVLISADAGGDGIDDYSSLHHAKKAGVSAASAATSEANALASQNAAATSESNADASEANALASKNAAATSASNAATSKTGADNAKSYAQEWANKAVDSLVSVAAGGGGVDDYSAMHHATKASESATAAATSATSADASEAGALVSKNAAATSESNALASKNAAATSASNAATSESNALASKNAAATSATNAATSKTGADNAKSYATEWANKAVDTLISVAAGGDGIDDYSSLHHAKKAADSASSASASASAASTSQGAASTSEANALASKNAAATSASNALASENAAATSATNAATSEANALSSKNLSSNYANAGVDVQVEAGKYSAYHWSEQARLYSSDQAIDIKFTPSGGTGATNVQAAIEELDAEKFNKSGGTVGSLTVTSNRATIKNDDAGFHMQDSAGKRRTLFYAPSAGKTYIITYAGDDTYNSVSLCLSYDGSITWGSNTVWHSGNDGSGSGLDADKLDGLDSSQFLRSDQNGTITGNLTISNATTRILVDGNSSGLELRDLTGNYRAGLYTFGAGETILRTYAGDGTLNYKSLDLGYDGSLTWNNQNVIHSGNIGSQSVASASNADKLDNLDSSQFLRSDASGTLTGSLTVTGGLTTTSSRLIVKSNDAGMFLYDSVGGPRAGFYGPTDGILYVTAYAGDGTSNGKSLVLNYDGSLNWAGYPVITGANIGSQSVNYASSAGNANTLDGFNTDGGATANTIAVRNGAGDIFARLFRTEYTADSSTNINYFVGMTSVGPGAVDNYMRPTSVSATRTALDLIPQASKTDATANRVMKTGAFGLGSSELASDTRISDANAIRVTGIYGVGDTWTGSPFPGTHGSNQGYIENFQFNVYYGMQRHTPINSSIAIRYRHYINGSWSAWTTVIDSGSIGGQTINSAVSSLRRASPGIGVADDYSNTAEVLQVPAGAVMTGFYHDAGNYSYLYYHYLQYYSPNTGWVSFSG